MIKAKLLNTETGKERETIGSGGMTAVINKELEEDGRATVLIENDFDISPEGRADMKATYKEILKNGFEYDRKMTAQAIHEAAYEAGYLSVINGVECIAFRHTGSTENE